MKFMDLGLNCLYIDQMMRTSSSLIKEHAHGIRRYQTAFPQGKMIEEDQFMSD